MWKIFEEKTSTRRKKGQGGFSLVEVIIAIAVLGIVALSMSYDMIVSLRVAKRTFRNAAAQQLAQERMETLAAINPINLSSANNLTESALTLNSMSFTRTSTITVNTDNSRTVVVTVAPNDASLGSDVSLTNTFPLWGVD